MQFWNVLAGIFVTRPRVTLLRFVAPEKTLLPSVVTEFGRDTFVIDELFANTPESMVVTPSGTCTEPPEPWYDLSSVPESFRTKPASVVWSACELCDVNTHTAITSAAVMSIQPILVLFVIYLLPCVILQIFITYSF